MNKIISIILLCSLLLVCISGCSIPDTNGDDSQGNNPPELQANDSDLIIALIGYLQELLCEYSIIDSSLAFKIDQIKNGTQPLHIGFDPSSYYFVCGYYNGTHESEKFDYCCATEYTWVKFENETEIQEYYNDIEFIVAFQINKASFVTDILSDETNVPNMEHFQIYKPNFNNGLNTNASITFDKTFIYLNSSNKSTIYHSTSAYYNNLFTTLPCIHRDDQFYITDWLYITYPDGEVVHTKEFGEYYDALVNIMDSDKYSVTDKYGVTTFYGFISIHDFVNDILK